MLGVEWKWNGAEWKRRISNKNKGKNAISSQRLAKQGQGSGFDQA